MLYLVYEGPDQVGKTTTRKLVEKQRKGEDVVIDRFIGSNIVYGTVFKRYSKKQIETLYNDEHSFNERFKPVLIYLYAPTKELIKRIEKDNHEKINENILTRSNEEFDKYFERCDYTHKLKIDTSFYTQPEVVELIISFLNHVESK